MRTIATLGVRLVVAVAGALGLSWVAARAPLVAAVVTVVGLVALGVAVVRAARAPQPAVALGMLVVFIVLALGLGAVVAAAGGGADAAAALAVDGARIEDTAGDCDGCGSDDLRALVVEATESATTLRLEVGGDPTATTFRIWDAAHPTQPIVVRHDGRWLVAVPAGVDLDPAGLLATDDDTALTLRLPLGLDGLAITSEGGDRLPDVGGVERPAGDGTVAAAVAEQLAMVQAGWGRLDDAQRLLAAGLVDSQFGSWTLTYDMASDANPGLNLQVRIAADAGRLAQDISIVREDGSLQPAQTLLVLDDRVLVCTHPPAVESVECVEGDVAGIPTSAAAAIARDPAAVRVVEVAPRDVDGSQRCVRVETTVEDGPNLGERCQAADGAMGYRDSDDTGQRLVLTGRAPLDPDLFTIPGA